MLTTSFLNGRAAASPVPERKLNYYCASYSRSRHLCSYCHKLHSLLEFDGTYKVCREKRYVQEQRLAQTEIMTEDEDLQLSPIPGKPKQVGILHFPTLRRQCPPWARVQMANRDLQRDVAFVSDSKELVSLTRQKSQRRKKRTDEASPSAATAAQATPAADTRKRARAAASSAARMAKPRGKARMTFADVEDSHPFMQLLGAAAYLSQRA